MTHDEFLSRVSERTGLSDRQETARAVEAVFEVLGERLRWSDVEMLGEDLPAGLTGPLRGAAHGQHFDLAELQARVASREHLRPGFALEHMGVVCQVLAEALSPATLRRLHEALPGPIAALFTPREPTEPFEFVHLDPSRRTLAEGRPGSRHPVSESWPGSRHPLSESRPERAHTESVARSANPHGDTKLSSTTGLTQEREHETLATGHPGARSPWGDED